MAAIPHEQQRQGQPVAGLFQSLSNFAGTLIAIAHTRLQLLTTELQEEVRQVGAMLLWAFIGIRQQILTEEAYLVRTYGEGYRQYARRIGRFLPGIGKLR